MTLNSFYNSNSRFKRTNVNFSDIAKSTKKMIINSGKYNSYINEYVEAIQIPSFKKPEVVCYPLLKNHSMISLTNKQFISENKDTKGKGNNKPFIKDSERRRISMIKLRDLACLEFHRPSKNNSTNQEASIKKKLYRCSSATALEREIDKRKCFINAFLPDYSFDNLVYDESQIFHRNQFYNNYIQSRIAYMKKNKLHNNTCELGMAFNKDTSREMQLKLSSMKIDFIKIGMSNSDKKSILLPFDLLFLFYYKGIEYFQHILLAMIKFNNENEQIDIDEEQFYGIIRTNLSLLNSNYKNSNTRINNLDVSLNESNDQSQEQSLYQKEEECSNNNSSNVNEDNTKGVDDENNNSIKENNANAGNYLKNTLTPHRISSQITNTIKSLTLNPVKNPKNEPNIIKTLNQNNYNSYSFIWITKHHSYQITITLPELQLILTKTQREVFRYVDRELILFLLERKFLNWDYFVINYLFSLKNFRFFIDSILSKSTLVKNTKINLVKETHGKTFLIKKDMYLSPKKEHIFSLEDYTFSFFYTNEKGKNYYQVLHSYTIKVRCEKIAKKKTWVFDFTFKQMLILNTILMYTNNLETFIMKILITDFTNGDIELDYSFFEHFDKNIFVLEDDEGNEAEERVRQTNIKGIEIIIEHPYLVRIAPESQCSNVTSSNDGVIIPKEILLMFEGLEINEWPKILMNPDLNKRSSIDVMYGSPKRKNKKMTHIGESPDVNKKRISTAAFAVQMFKQSPIISLKNNSMIQS